MIRCRAPDYSADAYSAQQTLSQGGFPHVIGTLWEINDEVAPHMAADFYAELGGATHQLGGLDTDAAAHALHHTVRKVRDRYPKSPYLWAAHLHAGI